MLLPESDFECFIGPNEGHGIEFKSFACEPVTVDHRIPKTTASGLRDPVPGLTSSLRLAVALNSKEKKKDCCENESHQRIRSSYLRSYESSGEHESVSKWTTNKEN